jgi:hypothetical protein
LNKLATAAVKKNIKRYIFLLTGDKKLFCSLMQQTAKNESINGCSMRHPSSLYSCRNIKTAFPKHIIASSLPNLYISTLKNLS